MSVCSTSGRTCSVVKLPSCLHSNRHACHSGRRAARLSWDTFSHQDLSSFVSSYSQLFRKAKRKVAQVVGRAQPKTLPIQGTETLAVLGYPYVDSDLHLLLQLSSHMHGPIHTLRTSFCCLAQGHLLFARIASATEHRGAETMADHLHLDPRHIKWHGTEC